MKQTLDWAIQQMADLPADAMHQDVLAAIIDAHVERKLAVPDDVLVAFSARLSEKLPKGYEITGERYKNRVRFRLKFPPSKNFRPEGE